MKFIFISFLIPFTLFAQPSPVTIVLPQDGSTSITSPANLIWNKSPLALAYTIQISTDSLFGSTIVNQSKSDTTYSTSVLQTSTRYYWRVRAENIDGASSWTNAMLTTKLNIPSLLNPPMGAIDVNLTPTLRWSSVLSSATYTVQLVVPSDIVVKKWDTTSTTITMDSLIRATTYYWRVRAYIDGDTATSNPSNFTTIPYTPATPNLIYPPDTSTYIPVNAVLRWSKIQNATSYNFQVSTSPIFSTLLKDSSFIDTLYRPKPFLNSNTQYYWRVNSANSSGTGSYSGTFRFTTGTDTNKAKSSFPNINLGTVKAGTVKDTSITITNTGNDDLIIYSFSNQLPGWASTGLTNTSVLSLAVSGTNLFAGTWGGGVFLSSNNGTSWTNTGLTNGSEIRSFAVSGTNLFAGTTHGIFLSTNNGTSWTQVNSGLTDTDVRSFAISGTNLFAGTWGGGVFLSTNNGSTWTTASTGLTGNAVFALDVSGTNLFAGTWQNGVFLSTNNGTSWINTGLTNTPVYALAVSSTNLFAGTDGGGVFLSTNNGTSWINTSLTNASVQTLAVSGTNLFAGTAGGGVFLSTNNGTSWTEVNTGLTNTDVGALAVSGTNLFAGTLRDGVIAGGVFRSEYIDLLPSISTSIISPGTSTTASIHLNSFPVGSVNRKIIVVSNASSSPDTITVTGFGSTYGMTLSSKNVNMGTVKVGQVKDAVITITNTGNDNLVISNIASDNPSFTVKPSLLTIATGTSVTDTIRFAPVTAGGAVGKIIIICNSLSPDTITVSANGSLTDVKDIVEIPKEYALSQNYPNPFNPSTTLRYGLPSQSRVRLVVYNVLGQVVTNLVNTEQPAGWNQVVWNANVSSGLYFYRIEATSLDNPSNRFVETKKMLLLR